MQTDPAVHRQIMRAIMPACVHTFGALPASCRQGSSQHGYEKGRAPQLWHTAAYCCQLTQRARLRACRGGMASVFQAGAAAADPEWSQMSEVRARACVSAARVGKLRVCVCACVVGACCLHTCAGCTCSPQVIEGAPGPNACLYKTVHATQARVHTFACKCACLHASVCLMCTPCQAPMHTHVWRGFPRCEPLFDLAPACMSLCVHGCVACVRVSEHMCMCAYVTCPTSQELSHINRLE